MRSWSIHVVDCSMFCWEHPSCWRVMMIVRRFCKLNTWVGDADLFHGFCRPAHLTDLCETKRESLQFPKLFCFFLRGYFGQHYDIAPDDCSASFFIAARRCRCYCPTKVDICEYGTLDFVKQIFEKYTSHLHSFYFTLLSLFNCVAKLLARSWLVCAAWGTWTLTRSCNRRGLDPGHRGTNESNCDLKRHIIDDCFLEVYKIHSKTVSCNNRPRRPATCDLPLIPYAQMTQLLCLWHSYSKSARQSILPFAYGEYMSYMNAPDNLTI